MEHRLLGRSGLKVPVLSFGTGTFGGQPPFFDAWGTTDVAEARKLVDICVEAGCTMFDSADVYSSGASEEILGKAIAHLARDRVLISTKVTFRNGEGANDVGSSRHYLLRAVDASLRRLGSDYVDLLQLHGFDALTPVEEGAAGWALTREQIAQLDEASATTLAYPYWHQRGFAERNPPPV